MVLKRFFVCSFLFVVIFARAGECQVLTTGQTLGKNNQVLMMSENRLFVDGVDLNIAYAQYARGLNKRFDFYGSVGETSIFGRNQTWLGAGGNLHLFTAKKMDASFFNVASTPLNRPREASMVLLNSALVVSRPVTQLLTLYTGLNGLFPIGARARGIFTPTTNKMNVPIGLNVSGKKWGLFVEGDIGRLKSVGIGIGRSF